MILSDKIKLAKEYHEVQDVLDKVEEWILHSAEEFEIQMKNAANFKRKYLKASERVDQLEDYQMNQTNEENRHRKKEDDMKKEINALNARLEQVESEKSCSYKREDKTIKQINTLKHDLKSYGKENNRLTSQLKAISLEKDRLKQEIRENHRSKEWETEKIKDLEQRIFQLLYEKDSIMEMLNTLERSIPSTEVQRLFSEYLSFQKDLFSLDEQKNKLENELLAKEKELRSTAKEEQLSNTVINMRKNIEVMRKDLATIEHNMEEIRGKLSSLKDELHWVEIHEKRRNEVIFETERTLLEQKEENEALKREINYVSNSKVDLERAYKAIAEEKQMIDRELMTLRSQVGSINNSVLTNKPAAFSSTLNPGDYLKNRILPSHNYTHSTNMGNGNETSSFVSPSMNNKHQSFYQNQSREIQREENTEEEFESDGEGDDQIIEQSYESESRYEDGEELSIHDKLKQVKETFNTIKSSMNFK